MLLLKGIDIHACDTFGRDALYYLSKFEGYDRFMMAKIQGDYNMGIRFAEECVIFPSYAFTSFHPITVGKIVTKRGVPENPDSSFSTGSVRENKK